MKYKLVCFDVDGTLVDNVVYSWSVFHEAFKTDAKRREKARDDYFSKKITYEEWAKHDILLWKEKNVRRKDMVEAMGNLRLMNGALETLETLKKNGLKLGIISGSINVILETLFPRMNEYFDYVFWNRIVFDDKGFIVDVIPTQFDIDSKGKALKQILEKEGIKAEECVFVGDHFNDVDVMQASGLGIAFDPKDEGLKKIADVIITKKDMREILRHIL